MKATSETIRDGLATIVGTSSSAEASDELSFLAAIENAMEVSGKLDFDLRFDNKRPPRHPGVGSWHCREALTKKEQ